ncbi:hypothetical protein BDN70DRAFT_674605 [Pholiota conissans]|uniref:Uncharacterized protein n=1 Tax=Pholiota conissans TaxID=109636 RepID=A0A9P5Z1I4_9AGAR|nr:hypothetical protein BDN70DRAFT_674605 [Pholiota conissans]
MDNANRDAGCSKSSITLFTGAQHLHLHKADIKIVGGTSMACTMHPIGAIPAIPKQDRTVEIALFSYASGVLIEGGKFVAVGGNSIDICDQAPPPTKTKSVPTNPRKATKDSRNRASLKARRATIDKTGGKAKQAFKKTNKGVDKRCVRGKQELRTVDESSQSSAAT